MSDRQSVDEVDPDVATAVGLFALSDATLHEAASRAEVTRWELETAIEQAGLSDVFGLDRDVDVSDTIDRLLEGQ